MKSIVPNSLTLANLACGLLAIIAIGNGNFWQAAYLISASLVFDFADGFVARALGVHSELGKQLDSLADVVSFGVVPGLLMFHTFLLVPKSGEPLPDFLPYIALLIPLFSALRLAKFNIDTRQEEYFIGLPTPANTLLIFSICLWGLYTTNATTQSILLHPFLLTLITVLSALLLVAELPLMSLKVKSFAWQENKGRVLLIVAAVLLMFVLRFRALAFIVPLYLLISLLFKPNK